MSYKTNSTANRFNISKGWKNPSFPETLTFYSRDNVFFFKLYLFLKAYFTLKKIRLIYCEVRLSANYTKLLYLVINTVPKKKWKRKVHSLQFTKRRSGMKYSPFRKSSIELSKNLLFFDLNKLKNQFKTKLLPLSKQKVSTLLYTKPRRKASINYLNLLNKTRLAPKLKYKQKLTKFAPVYLDKLNTQQIMNTKLVQIKKEVLLFSNLFHLLKTKNLLNTQNLNFYKENLKVLQKKLENLKKYNKKVLNVQAKVSESTKKGYLNLYKIWFARKTLVQLKKSEFLLKKKLNKGTQIYKQSLNYIKSDKKNTLSKNTLKRMKRKFTSVILNDNRHKVLVYRLISSYIIYMKATNTINTERSFTKFLRLFNMQQILQHHQNLEHVTIKNNSVKISKKQLFIKKSLLHYPLSKKKLNVVRHSKQTKSYITPYSFQTFKNLRRSKKVLYYARSFYKLQLNSAITGKLAINELLLLKKNYRKEVQRKRKKKNIWKLRQTFRKTYKSHVNTLTRYQYKLGLQSVLQKFFYTKLELKFVQPLSKFKNLKFLRLVYPKRRRSKRSKSKTMNYKVNKQLLKIKLRKQSKMISNKDILHKPIKRDFVPIKLRYIYVGNRARRLKISSRQIYMRQRKNSLKLKRQNLFKAKLKKKLYLTKQKKWKRKKLRQVKKIKYLLRKTSSIEIKKVIKGLSFKHKTKQKLLKTKPLKIKPVRTNSLIKSLSPLYKSIKKSLKKTNKHYSLKEIRFGLLSYRKQRNRKKFNKKCAIKSKYFKISLRFKSTVKLRKLKYKNFIKRKNTYIFKKKTDVFKRLRRNKLLEFTKTRLQSVKRQLLMNTLTPILSLCVKYINPQILADHIAKEFEKTKKHRSIIFSLSTALRSLKLSRAMGYRIAIVGRINSADKSRVYYLTRKVLVRQNFANKVNFASAQAKARIGSFGIKVWMFY